jgi:hypothetical protein
MLWSSGLACCVVLSVISIFKVGVECGCSRLHRQVCRGGVFCMKHIRVFCTPSKIRMVKLSLSLLWRYIEGNKGIAPLVGWRWVVTFLSQLLYPWERTPVLTEYETGANLVVQELVWTLWQRASLASFTIQTVDHPAWGMVTILTAFPAPFHSPRERKCRVLSKYEGNSISKLQIQVVTYVF